MKAGAPLGNAIVNFGAAFALLLLQSWIADGIKGDELFPWWPGGKIKPGEPGFAPVVATMALLSAVFAAFLYQRRRSFLPVQVQRIGQPGRVEPHRALILTLSRAAWQWTPTALVRGDGTTHPLPPTVAQALVAMASLGEREKFSWEQILRAVAAHQPRLGRLILICSAGGDGSARRFDECRHMIRHYFPALGNADVEKREADFDALDDLLREYRQAIAAEAGSRNDIMIDVTGGTKVVSIAAAMVTLEHPEIEFQYVETGDEKRVRSFNVTTPGSGEAGAA